MRTFTEDEVKQLMQQQAHVTCKEIALFCAEICDKNKGNLSIGHLIKKHFGLGEETFQNVPGSGSQQEEKVIVKPKTNSILRVVK